MIFKRVLIQKPKFSKPVSVIIPIYKIDLCSSEIRLLHQCLKLLEKYHITFISPESLDFKEFCQKNKIKNRSKISFPNSFFDGIEGYNKLLLSEIFYNAFSEFEYILIYQLDAWVFKDDLSFWLAQGYDYIGAPWKSYDCHEFVLNGVGNGGFSLRRVITFQKILSSFRLRYAPLKKFPELFYESLREMKENKSREVKDDILSKISIFLKTLIKASGYKNNLVFLRSSGLNEDVFWGICVPIVFSDFCVASTDIASKFSIETTPEAFMDSISPEIPFGCHAWEKWGEKFWQPYIESSANK